MNQVLHEGSLPAARNLPTWPSIMLFDPLKKSYVMLKFSPPTLVANQKQFCGSLFAFFCFASVVAACNIPVFRYALENWRPDPYQVYVLHRGNLNQDQSGLVKKLAQARDNIEQPANLNVVSIDLDTVSSDDKEAGNQVAKLLAAEYGKRDHAEPLITMFYPSQANELIPVWDGELNETNVAAVVDSAARVEIRKRLVDGQSAVWVFIPCGDEAKDAAAEKMLAEQLEQMKQIVELPAQDLIEAEEEFQADNPIELRVDFSYVKVDRSDSQEAPFVASLLRSEPDLADLNEPITLPIYGRGRTYFALVGKGINPVTIEENCQFICGACSCQVKQSNPGVDTLMAFDWDSKVVGTAMKEIELPELTGIGHFESNQIAMATDATENDLSTETTSTTTTDDDQITQVAQESSSEEAQDVQTSQESTEAIAAAPDSPFEKNLLLWSFGGVAGIALVVGIFSIFLFRSNG